MKLTNKQMINMHTTLIEIGNRGDIDPVLGVNIARNNYELSKMTEPVLNEKEKLLEKYPGRRMRTGSWQQMQTVWWNSQTGRNIIEEYNRLMDAEGEVSLILFTMGDIKKMAPSPKPDLKSPANLCQTKRNKGR